MIALGLFGFFHFITSLMLLHLLLSFMLVSTQFGCAIKAFSSDNGGEFINKYLASFCDKLGIVHQTSCPHSPKHGIAERKHRHLIETTITLLHQARLPTSFWLETLLTTVYLVNRLPTSSLNFIFLFSFSFTWCLITMVSDHMVACVFLG